MQWYVLALGSILFNAVLDTVRRVLLSGKNKIDYYSTAFLLSFVTAIALIIYTSATKFVMPPIQNFKLLFVINIVAGVIGLLTNQIGLSLVGLGEFTILMTSRQVITWVASLIFLGVGLTLSQGIGSILILFALILVFIRKVKSKRYSTKGVFFTYLTSIIYGLAFIVDLLIYRKSDPASYLVFAYGLTAIILFIFKPNVVRTLKYINFSKRGLGILVIGVFSGISSVLLFTALKRANNAPLVSGLTQFQIMLSVIFGVVILRERKRLAPKLIGTVLATVGAILMAI